MPRVQLLNEKFDTADHRGTGRNEKKWFRLFFCLSVSLVLGFWLFQVVDVSATLHLLTNIQWPLLAGAVLSLMLTHGLNCLRWRWCLLDEGQRMPFWAIAISYWTSMFVGMALPTEYGGDMLRIKDVWDRIGSGSTAIASVAWSRVSGIGATLYVFTLLGLTRPARLKELSIVWPWAISAALCVGIAVIIIGGRIPDHAKRMLTWTALPTRLRKSLIDVLSRVVTLATHCTYAWRIAGLAVLAQAIMIVTNTLYAWALGHRVTVFDMALVVPLVMVSSMLPVSFGGLGVKEGAFVIGLSAIGLSPEAALSVALLNRLVLVALALTGGLLFPLRRRLLES